MCWTIHLGPEYLGHNKMSDHREDKLLGEGERVCKWMIGITLRARKIENGKGGMEIITSNKGKIGYSTGRWGYDNV
jgi:hypothetical protein